MAIPLINRNPDAMPDSYGFMRGESARTSFSMASAISLKGQKNLIRKRLRDGLCDFVVSAYAG
jgi:hypothetical protein